MILLRRKIQKHILEIFLPLSLLSVYIAIPGCASFPFSSAKPKHLLIYKSIYLTILGFSEINNQYKDVEDLISFQTHASSLTWTFSCSLICRFAIFVGEVWPFILENLTKKCYCACHYGWMCSGVGPPIPGAPPTPAPVKCGWWGLSHGCQTLC